MKPENEKLFCELGIDLGFLTNSQVTEALNQQGVDRTIGVSKPIGAYLFETKHLTKEQISQILKIQNRVENQTPTNYEEIRAVGDELTQEEQFFCEIALDIGFIVGDQIKDLLKQRKVDAAIGNAKPLGAYLFELKLLNREQISKILAIQERIKKQEPNWMGLLGKLKDLNLTQKLEGVIDNLKGIELPQIPNISSDFSRLKDGITILSAGLLISFFLPWGSLFGFTASGYYLGTMGSYGNLAWLIPLGSIGTIVLKFVDPASVNTAGFFTGLFPWGFFIYGVSKMGSDIFQVLSIGAYLSLLFGVLLVFTCGNANRNG